MKEAKKPSASKTIMTELVLPNDTNVLSNLRGGKILHWMDIASAIAAGKHANKVMVTVSVDHVAFINPIKVGDVVTIEAKVTRAFNTSVETYIEVWAENLPTQHRYRCNDAYYTFVALDSNGRPTAVPGVEPETKDEQDRFDGALRRRQLRLILAGRMKPSEATEIKTLFDEA